IDLVGERAAGRLLDRFTPCLERLLQRMRRRDPVGQLEFEAFFLRLRAGSGANQCGESGSVDSGRETGSHGLSPSNYVFADRIDFAPFQPKVELLVKPDDGLRPN